MAESWTVTDEDGDYARTYPGKPGGTAVPGEWAMDADDAATLWGEWMCAQEAEYPDERIAIVTASDGTVTRWVVTIEAVPHFSARQEVPHG